MFGLVMSIYMFCLTLANSGINLATTRIISEELAIKSFGSKTAIKKCILLSIIFSFITSLLLFVFSPFILKYFLHNRINVTSLYLIAISIPFTAITMTLNGYFTAGRKPYKSSSADVLNLIVKITTILFLMPYFDLKDLNQIILILIIGTTIAEICSFIYIFTLYIIDKRKLNDYRTIKNDLLNRILKISIPVALTSYIRSGLSTLKQLLIPLQLEKYGLSCSSSLSIYGKINGMAMSVLLFPGIVINTISSLLIPEFARYNIKKDFTKMNSVISKLFSLVIIFSLFIIGFFLLFSDEIGIITYKDISVGNYILILCPLVLLMYIDHIIDAILRGIDKQVKVMYVNILDLFISLILIFILLPKLGIIGYILVIYISEILNTTISAFQLYKATHFSFDIYRQLIFPCIYLIISLFITYFINFSNDNTIMYVVLNGTTFASIYVILNLVSYIL